MQAQVKASQESQQSLLQEHLAEKEKLAEKLEQEEKLKARIQQLTEEKAVSSSAPGKQSGHFRGPLGLCAEQ